MQTGVIMGYYGHIWQKKALFDYASFCKNIGIGHFIYAPKQDDYLRAIWQQNWPREWFHDLQEIRALYKQYGIKFGVALRPVNLSKFNADTKKLTLQRLAQINDQELDSLTISFDDIDINETGVVDKKLAVEQINFTLEAINHSNSKDFYFTPSYYSYSGILLSLLGNSIKERNEYLEQISSLPAKINILWAGDDIINKGIPKTTIEKINHILKRNICLWDNYPVNDPGWMRQNMANCYPLTGRTHKLSTVVKEHFANPMLQPYISQLALASLPAIYQQANEYSAEEEFIKNLKIYAPELKDFMQEEIKTLDEIS